MSLFSWLRELRDTSPSRIEKALAQLRARVLSVDIRTARERALTHLRSGELFQSGQGLEPLSDVQLEGLSEATRTLFREFREIESGSARLSAGELKPLVGRDGYWVIGSDLEHATVVTHASDDRVWVLEPNDVPKASWPEPYPSVWHYLLMVEATSHRDWWKG